MDQLSKYTLKFKEKEIEEKYQSQSFQKHLKLLFYSLLVMALTLNVLQLTFIIEKGKLENIYINMGFIIICPIGLYAMYKYEGLTTKIATFTNIYTLSLQFNFDPENTENQEYFLYGCNFSLIQTVIYFSTDFNLSCPSLLLHIIFRQTSTILLTKRIDIQCLFLSVGTAILTTCVLYICNRAQRIQFLMSYQQDTINNQLNKLIHKPFTKIQYNEKKLYMDVQTIAIQEQFENYRNDLCTGCNVRNFIRNCVIDNISLEQAIIKDQVKFDEEIEVKFQRKKIKLRLCKYNIDNSIILIQENVQQDPIHYNKISQDLQLCLLKQFNAIRKTPLNQQFQFGIISILMLRQFKIRTINMKKLIKNLMFIYLQSKKVKLDFNGNYPIKLRTYGYLIKIFLIQVFSIFQNLEYQQNYLEEINIKNLETHIQFNITLIDQSNFYQLYLKNYFIQQTAPYLLLNPLNQNLEFQFSKMLSFGDFNLEY